LNPHAGDLRRSRPQMIKKRQKPQVKPVSEGGLEPFAYLLASEADPWLTVSA
jgi:hypothetical protein